MQHGVQLPWDKFCIILEWETVSPMVCFRDTLENALAWAEESFARDCWRVTVTDMTTGQEIKTLANKSVLQRLQR